MSAKFYGDPPPHGAFCRSVFLFVTLGPERQQWNDAHAILNAVLSPFIAGF